MARPGAGESEPGVLTAIQNAAGAFPGVDYDTDSLPAGFLADESRGTDRCLEPAAGHQEPIQLLVTWHGNP